MTEQKQQQLQEIFHQFLSEGINFSNPDFLKKIVKDSLFGFGTATAEKIGSLDEFIELLNLQNAQAEGMDVRWETKPFGQYLSEGETVAVFANDLWFHLTIEGAQTDMYLRITVVLEYKNDTWQVVHWHLSKPENVQTEEDTWGIESWKEKAKELEKLVAERTAVLERKNRELEIETALERVRVKTMSMHHTSELQEVIHTVHQELLKLNLGIHGGSFIVINSEIDKELRCWGSGGTADTSDEIHIPYFGKRFYTTLVKGIKKGPGFFTEAYSQKEKNEFFSFLFNHEPWSKLKAKEKKETLSSPGGYTRSCCVSKHTSIFIINHFGEKFSEEDNEILERFGKVFEQTYTRFLDLQKAEAQTREAQIEVAVERVRAQSMAMHHPDDLDKVNKELLNQLKWLQIEGLSGVTFYLVDEDGWVKAWDFSSPGNIGDQTSYTLQFDYNKHEMLGYPFKILRQTKLDYFVADYPLEKLKKAVYEFEEIDSTIAAIVKEALATGALTHQWSACVRISNGLLGIDLVNPPNEDTKTIGLKMAGAFNQAYTRFLDLQKAEAQVKEARIEAALERVRAASMAMHKSDELQKVVSVLFEQLQTLDFALDGAAFIATKIENYKGFDFWMEDKMTLPSRFRLPYYDAPSINEIFDAWEKRKDFSTKFFGKEKNIWFKYAFKYTDLKIVPEDRKQWVLAQSYLTQAIAIQKNSLIGIHVHHEKILTVNEIDILKRFSKVFEQSFVRFLDLQKAEAQAREAQIEAGLERVRSKSLAMFKTEDLGSVVNTLFEEMQGLSVEMGFASVSIFIFQEGSKDLVQWLKLPDGVASMHVPYFEHPISSDLLEAKEMGVDYFARRYTVEEKNSWVKKGFELTDYKNLPKEIRSSILEAPGYAMSIALSKSSGICIPSFVGQLPSEEDIVIMKRFSKVFEQAYTRFLDLQKAEAQAREGKIEAALERVRARTMAMQHSDELADASFLLDSQVRALGIKTRGCAFNIYGENESTEWFSSEMGTMPVYKTPRENVFLTYYEEGQKGKQLYIDSFEGDVCAAHYDYLCTLPVMGEALKKMKENGGSFPTQQIDHITYFKYGYLLFITLEQVPEAHDIFIRFTKVFEQTYTRFLDLQKAEAQAREAQVETALEKVRSRTLAMQHSDELAETASELFRQMIGLGIEPNRLYITIINQEKDQADFWITDEDGSKLIDSYSADLNDNTTFTKMYDGWKQQLQHLVIDMQGEELQNYFLYLQNKHVPFKGGLGQKRRVQHLAYFSKGFIGLASPEEQPIESIQILERFAAVFNLTFTRFNDLKMAEAHALQAEKDLIEIKEAREKAEKTLIELQATQNQLIQSEKMASLGQLTAGIAHEIQNPLNFVNNFSEVSKELLDEMRAAIDNGDAEEAKEILNDVIQNLEKINHHGKRADGIVKGMLQHSRSSSASKTPTDINKLADEYLRLAYHGLRSKNKSFNAVLETDYDETIGFLNIIPQDIGRVILNVINNAFYAAPLPPEGGFLDPDYVHSPTVWVKTKRVNSPSGDGGVLISVKDNGPGIPRNIIDKIFQPFFTTKPTGQGTGLGLSLAYDIVKAHGGELKVETKENEGTEFIIQLPITTS